MAQIEVRLRVADNSGAWRLVVSSPTGTPVVHHSFTESFDVLSFCVSLQSLAEMTRFGVTTTWTVNLILSFVDNLVSICWCTIEIKRLPA